MVDDTPPDEVRAMRAARPQVREKLIQLGAGRLCDFELVALLLGSGVRGRSVLDLAREMLVKNGGLAGLAVKGGDALAGERGLGPVGVGRLVAAFEIGRRLARGPTDRPTIRDPDEVVREVRDLAGERREHLIGLYLDAHARLIARETIAVGSLNVARATPRDLLEPAIRLLAAGFVMAHNHPSGAPEPSEDDILFTRTVGRAAFMMGVPLWDHVVVAQAGCSSLRARGVLWDGQDASVQHAT
jgi:DNA repair protein RadC